MTNSDMLARLVAQMEGDGADVVTIRALIEEASTIGAQRTLDRLGLSDRGAERDVRELRELLGAWRDAKAAARNAVLGWMLRGALALMLIGMAVALSSRPLLRVERIWADGKLLRGAAGDFKTALAGFRLAQGDPDQPVDPLMGAATGGGSTPANRGIAYAVFDGLELADFGNRIPSLTFEVVADEGLIDPRAVAHDLSTGIEAVGQDEGLPPMTGYVAAGDNTGECVAPLLSLYGLEVQDRESGVQLTRGARADGSVTGDLVANAINGRAADRTGKQRLGAELVPLRVAVHHYDPSRDYQTSVQTAARNGDGRATQQLQVPVTLVAGTALALADQSLARQWAGRSRLILTCDWRALALGPGMVTTVEGQPGLWQVKSSHWSDMRVQLTLHQVSQGSASLALPASPGVAVAQADVPHGPTSVIALELPALGDGTVDSPLVAIGAAGESPGWRGAALYVRTAAGDLQPLGQTPGAAIVGTVLSVPGPGSALLFDEANSVILRLPHDRVDMTDASDLALLQGANLCLVGEEMMQFGRADPLGEGVWRLSRLMRGRRGSEHRITGHQIGEPFVMIDNARLFMVPAAQLPVGGTVRIAAIGIGDTVPSEAAVAVSGTARLPLTPVGLKRRTTPAGLLISWIRRSRSGWRWTMAPMFPLARKPNAIVSRSPTERGCCGSLKRRSPSGSTIRPPRMPTICCPDDQARARSPFGRSAPMAQARAP